MKRKVSIALVSVAAMVLVVVGLPLVVAGIGPTARVAWADEEDQPEVARRAFRLQEHIVRGTVKEVGDDVVLVKTNVETVTVLITDTTYLWVPGQPPTTTIDVAVEDPLLALGRPVSMAAEGKALSARLLVVVAEENLPKVVIQGKIVAITPQTLVVATGRGERAITILPRTQIWSAAGRLDTLRLLRRGDRVLALGHPTEMGQWMAGMVYVSNPRLLARHGVGGAVLARDEEAGTLTVQTKRRGEITVVVSDGTRYRLPGVEEPGLADIQEGDRIVAVGRFEEGSETEFLARGVAVFKPSPD